MPQACQPLAGGRGRNDRHHQFKCYPQRASCKDASHHVTIAKNGLTTVQRLRWQPTGMRCVSSTVRWYRFAQPLANRLDALSIVSSTLYQRLRPAICRLQSDWKEKGYTLLDLIYLIASNELMRQP